MADQIILIFAAVLAFAAIYQVSQESEEVI